MGVVTEIKEHITDARRHGSFVADESGVVHGEAFVIGDSYYARYQRFVGRFGVEQRGVERIPEDERTDKHTFKAGTMWCASNMVVSSFAIGALAVPIFNLGFVDGLLAILFFNLLGILPVCFFSMFGPVFGLRQIILSRFFFGYYGVKVIAVFNCLACLGWSAVNVIVGAQLLHAVNADVPGWAGIIVIGAATFVITLFGYRIVHYYEMISWIPCFIIFLITLGVFAHSGAFINIPMGVGTSEAASVLSFGASVFGFATGWTSYAADYTCYQPRNANRLKDRILNLTRKVLAATPVGPDFQLFLGLIFPLCFTEMLGLAIATATAGDASNGYLDDAYFEDHIGGLLAAVLFPPLGGFGKFCVVVLALSIIGNNCPNIYSLTFSLQILSRHAQLIPRSIWTLIGTIIYCAIAIPGYNHFESVLENFMLVIAYWLAIYEGVSLPEHFIFKKGFAGYAPDTYDVPGKLPPSIAALSAFCFGVFGAVMGMAQQWFVGPIGARVGGKFGGDIGFELAFAFTFASYVAFRTIERKHFAR